MFSPRPPKNLSGAGGRGAYAIGSAAPVVYLGSKACFRLVRSSSSPRDPRPCRQPRDSRSQFRPISAPRRSKNSISCCLPLGSRFGRVLARFLVPFWGPSWPIWGSFWRLAAVLFSVSFPKRLSDRFGPVWGSILGVKIGEKRGRVVDFQQFRLSASDLISGPSLGRFWHDLGVQVGLKIAPKRGPETS